jgi:hypothetical protein
MMYMDRDNIYMRVPIERVQRDAIAGVILARRAWRIRQPDVAAQALGYVIEPNQQAKQKHE